MDQKSGVPDRIIEAALALAAQRPWREVTLAEIAEQAETDLAGLQQSISRKSDIIEAFVRKIDQRVLSEGLDTGPEDTARDALFEVLMNRFDAMQPYKVALNSIAGSQLPDPYLVQSLLRSQAWMLQSAGIHPDGIKGGIRTLGLAGVYNSVFQTWLEDDDPGHARTMAVLDRRLRRGERVLKNTDVIVSGAEQFCSMLCGILSSRRQTGGTSNASDPNGV